VNVSEPFPVNVSCQASESWQLIAPATMSEPTGLECAVTPERAELEKRTELLKRAGAAEGVS